MLAVQERPSPRRRHPDRPCGLLRRWVRRVAEELPRCAAFSPRPQAWLGEVDLGQRVAMETLKTSAVRLLGNRYPIMQTAMGWVATSQLVIASVRAGAFGFLACAVMRPEEAEQEVRIVLDAVDGPFGVNFHSFQPGAERIVDMVIDHGVRAVSYGRSPSPKLLGKLQAAGVLCVPTVGALKHARRVAELGADIIVCQGGEGGGHTGSTPTMLLLAQVLDSVAVPVMAAGGFRDGRGLTAALAFGASGIAMGTRFLLTRESAPPAVTKERYLAADVAEIRISRKLDGLPQRMVMNETLARLERSGRLALLARGIANGWRFRAEAGASIREFATSAWSMVRNGGLTLSQALMAANAPMIIRKSMVHGRPSEGVLPGGQVAGLIDDLPTCDALVAGIMADAQARIAALAEMRGAA